MIRQLPKKTQMELERILPLDLASIAHLYLLPTGEPRQYIYDCAAIGHWELCSKFIKHNPGIVLLGACAGGQKQIAEIAISHCGNEEVDHAVAITRDQDCKDVLDRYLFTSWD